MAKTRLNQSHRAAMLRLAEELTEKSVVEYQVAIDKARVYLGKVALAWVTQYFPAVDMDVLERYHLVEYRDKIYVEVKDTDGSIIDRMDIHLPQKVRTLARNHYSGWVLPTDELYKANTALKGAINDKTEAKDRIMNNYRKLVNSSRNYEDVIEVWPEVVAVESAVIGKAVGTAVSLLTTDVVRAIQADMKAREGR